MSLLEFLRKTNKYGQPMRFIKEAYQRKHNLKRSDDVDPLKLHAFTRDYRTRGEKLIAVDTVWRFNDRYYGQWLALHVPYQKLEDLHIPEVAAKVPSKYYHLAMALQWRRDYWREPGLHQARRDMELEGVNRTQIETVIAMLQAKTHMIDQYLAGKKHDEAQDTEDNPIHSDAEPLVQELDNDPAQQLLINKAKQEIDKALAIITSTDEDEVDRLQMRMQLHAKAIAVTGPPGCGKSTCAKQLIQHVVKESQRLGGGKVLVTYPTGEMQSRMRRELKKAGLHVDVDTCHGAFQLHKPEQDVILNLEEYVLIVVDEFPQLACSHFERIIRLWESLGKRALLLFLGDFNQLPSVEGTTAKDSAYWKHVFKVKLHKSWRSEDEFLLKKLHCLRKSVPNKRMLNSILRNHKAWDHKGAPDEADIRALYERTDKQTTIATDTKKAAQEVNIVAAKVDVGKKQELANLPADYEVNPDNFTKHGKLRQDRRPIPSRVSIRKGLRLVLTKNLDKEHDFVNGMACFVKAWDECSRCLEVQTITGRTLEVYQYTNPDPKAQNTSYFPIRLGYASSCKALSCHT